MRPKSVLFLSAALLSVAFASAGAQTASDWVLPRTEYGQPDLQGLWGNTTLTPMERPRDLGEKLTYSPDEVAAMEAKADATEATKQEDGDPNRAAPLPGVAIGNEAEAVYSDVGVRLMRIRGAYPTSLITDPADGRFPFVENARQKDIYGQWRAQGFGEYDGPEIRSAGERCLSAIGTMPPMVLLPYNSNVQIVQNQDYVMMLGEMVHDVRIIRLDSEHQPEVLRYWFGDSVGRWEGDTLAVHSKHYRPEISNFRVISSADLEVAERFTRISDTEIFYTYTVTDPQIYTQPYTVEMILTHLPPDQKMYEFACHEGNYSMASILAGARRQDRLASQD